MLSDEECWSWCLSLFSCVPAHDRSRKGLSGLWRGVCLPHQQQDSERADEMVTAGLWAEGALLLLLGCCIVEGRQSIRWRRDGDGVCL